MENKYEEYALLREVSKTIANYINSSTNEAELEDLLPLLEEIYSMISDIEEEAEEEFAEYFSVYID